MSQQPRKLYEILKNRRHREFSFNDICSGAKNSYNLLMRLGVQQEVHGHNGCVNSVRWSSDGRLLLTGADDKYLHIYSYPDFELKEKIQSGHETNIYNAKFLPHSSDTKIVSCSNDGKICYNDIRLPRNYGANVFSCHNGVVFDVITHNQDPFGFLSCGEDHKIRYFDLRIRSNCKCEYCDKYVLIDTGKSVTACAINPYNINEISTACGDGVVRMFDRRMIFVSNERRLGSVTNYFNEINGLVMCYKYKEETPVYRGKSDRMTCLTYNETGDELLASYIPNAVVLFSTRPKRNVTASDIMRVREIYSDNLACMPGDMRNKRVNPKLFSESSIINKFCKLGIGRAASRRHENPNFAAEFQSLFYTLSNQANSDDQNQTFGRDDASSFTDVGPDLRSERGMFHRNLSNDVEFSTDSNSGFDRSILFSRQGGFEHTDPAVYDSSVDFDDHRQFLTDVSNPYQRLRNSRCYGRFKGSGAIFNLPKEKFFDSYNEITVDQLTPYDRLRNYTNGVFVPEYFNVYTGHCNMKTVIKECNFYGDQYIVSGSDCGNCFVWDRYTKKVVHIFKGDGLIVNSVQPHPSEPILACSGIDHTTKIIAPVLPHPRKNPAFNDVIRDNHEWVYSQTSRTGQYMLGRDMIFQVLLSMDHAENNPTDIVMRAIQRSDGSTVFYELGAERISPLEERFQSVSFYSNFQRSGEIHEETIERDRSPSDDYTDFQDNDEWSIGHSDSDSSTRLYDYES